MMLRDVQDPDDAIRSGKSPRSTPLQSSSGLHGKFYFDPSHPSPPSWVQEVDSIVESPVTSVSSASASGLLVLKTSGEFFAITFGYGKSFLDPTKIQRQFGLRVALNRIDPAQIRSMDTKTFEDMVVTKATQTSKSADIPTFGVDVARDILRAVAGEPRDRTFARRLAGSDALLLAADIEIKDIAKKCDELLVAYRDTAYKADFEWIDYLEVVQDLPTLTQLDGMLETQLKASDTSRTHMAMPEPVAWEDIDCFRISGTRSTEYEDLDLDLYLSKLSDATASVTVDLLRNRHVSVRYTRSGNFDSLWNVYQCLVSEQRLNGRLFALIEGRWFAIDKTLVDQVNSFLSTIQTRALALNDAAPDETEPVYNERMARDHPGDLLLLDAKIKRPGGASSGIEFCDLLSANGDLIHVKRKSRSSTLSHLFAQGSVSATTFVSDGPYRDELRSAISAAAPPADRTKWLDLVPDSATSVNKQRYTICYVVLTKNPQPGTDWLPFFSKLNLMQHGRTLANMGFDFTVTALSN